MKPEDFRQIIAQAIEGEVEAFNFYRAVSDQVQDAGLKSIFAELAGDEMNHREFLQGIMAKGPDSLHVDEAPDYKVADMLETPPLSMSLKPVDGIILAIRKELDAMQMYTQLSRVAQDSGEKTTFLELAKMEQGHKARLENIYTSMAFSEVW